jgi:hypothetical protein
MLIIFSIITISATLVAYAGGGPYGSGGYKGEKGSCGSGGFKSGRDSYKGEGIKSIEATKPDRGTISHSTTLGQELIDLEAAYRKNIITEEEYNRLKNIIIDQKTGIGK